MTDEAYIHPTAVIDPGAVIEPGARVWHFCHVSEGAVVGARSVLGQNVYLAPGVVIGPGCKLQNNVSLYEGVSCEADVFIGPSAVFTNVLNPRAAISRREQFRPTRIERGASIGANATLVCGVTLGAYCFVGAGAVVTKHVPAHALVVGVPARRVGWVSAAGHRLKFDSEGLASCPETGQRYRLRGGEVLPMT